MPNMNKLKQIFCNLNYHWCKRFFKHKSAEVEAYSGHIGVSNKMSIFIDSREINFDLYLSKELYKWSIQLNNKKWLCIRKIYFQEQYLYSGNLENMFDEFISKIPNGYYLWCNISNKELNQYITQIGGFTDLPIGICPNTSIRIFNVYQRNNE